MKLFAEEDVVNTFLNKLQKQFVLHSYKLTVVPGESLIDNQNTKMYQTALKDSLDQLTKSYHQTINEKTTNYHQLSKDNYYILIYEESNNQLNLRMIIPYGANLSAILMGALIVRPKDNQLNISDELTKLSTETLEDIVIHEMFKYYEVKKGTDKPFEKSITDSIRYQPLKSDNFNMVMKFTLPLKDIYHPLKQAIESDHTRSDSEGKPITQVNYNQLAPTNLVSLAYNKDNDSVTFVTSLY